MEAIETNVRTFFDAFTSNKFTIEQIHEIINLAYPSIEWMKMSSDDNSMILKVISDIREIMNIKFTITERLFVTRDKKEVLEQHENQYSFLDLINMMESRHYHCTPKAKCEFHPESLLTHSVMTMFVSTLFAIKNKLSYNEMLEIAFLGLIHDIGKVSCQTVSNINEKTVVTFPFHGEMGCGILLQMFSPDLSRYFSKLTWENICRTICVHMNYHLSHQKNSYQVLYDMDLLSIENENVKKYLEYLTVGDFIGCFGHKTEDIMECLKIFDENISKTFDMTKFMSTYLMKGIVILIRGMSASGKTSFIKRISEYLTTINIKFKIINRDDIITEFVMKSCGESGRTDKYYYDLYQTNKDKYSWQINAEIRNMISSSLSNNEVVVLDTLMNYFDSIESITPSNMRDAFIMSVDVVRNTIITETDCARHSMSMKTQLELAGSKSVMCWLAKECSLRIRHISSLSSSSTMTVDYIRPRLCHIVSWNSLDMFGVDEFIRQLSVLVRYVPETKMASMNILEYANRIYKIAGWDALIGAFKSYKFIVTECLKSSDRKMICVKYRDNSDKWAPMWARQCRGIVLMLNDDKVVCVKYQLPRGAESLTTLHVDKKITDTQDMSVSTINRFDIGQQHVMKLLIDPSDQPINGALTFKCDGSLLGCTVYFGYLEPIIEKMILEHGDEYSKTVLNLGRKVGLTCVISSQGTFMIAKPMHNYSVTSILTTGMKTEDIYELAKTHTCIEMLEKYGLPFFEKVKNFIDNYKAEHGCVTLNFETVCSNRVTAWGDFHSELAISYPDSFYRFLGISTSSGEFIPHFRTINTQFDEPMWWKIETTKRINDMLLDLSKCIRNIITQDDFLMKYPVSNKVMPKTKFFDYEGFVFYTIGTSPFFEYDYHKIKTLEYYMTHKFRTDNVPYLMELSRTARSIFPMVGTVCDFFESIKTKITIICGESHEGNQFTRQ
jgi:tRNA A37 threonylcarbamoyladenosine biosynthesis protein TsaE